jgi:hypothetical protein
MVCKAFISKETKDESEDENMGLSIPKGPLCQSCAMPMEKPEDFGTNADGSKSNDYCHYCFQKGKFTEPNLTVEQMIDKVSNLIMTKMKMSETQAKQMATMFIPTLERWRK